MKFKKILEDINNDKEKFKKIEKLISPLFPEGKLTVEQGNIFTLRVRLNRTSAFSMHFRNDNSLSLDDIEKKKNLVKFNNNIEKVENILKSNFEVEDFWTGEEGEFAYIGFVI